MKRIAFVATGCFLAAIMISRPLQAQEDEVAKFYQGKTISMIVGAPAGGGFDNYARFLVRHMQQFVPGKPNFVVQNVPGAGGLVAANSLYNRGAKDGTVMAAFHRGIAYDPLFGAEGVQYEPDKFIWIGSLNKDANLAIAWHTSPAKRFEDALEKEVIIGASAAGADSVVYPKILNKLLGTKFKVVPGYETPQLNMAMERGEVHGRVGAPWSHVKVAMAEWLREGKINILVQLSLVPSPGVSAPMLFDFVKDEETRKVFELLFIRQEAGRPYALPPGVPEARAAALRKAFLETTKSPAFQKEAEQLGLLLEVMDGAQVQALVEKAYKSDPALVQKVRTLLSDL